MIVYLDAVLKNVSEYFCSVASLSAVTSSTSTSWFRL